MNKHILLFFLSISLCFKQISAEKPSQVIVSKNDLQALCDSLDQDYGSTLNKDFALLVAGVTAAAMAYGVSMDQITTRNCIEYFNGNLPSIMHHTNALKKWGVTTENKTLIALFFGIWATWHVGLIGGAAVAGASRVGDMPKLRLQDLKRELLCAVGGMSLATLVAGIYGYSTAKNHGYFGLNPKEYACFRGNAYAHSAAYLSGGVAVIALLVAITRKRLGTLKGEKIAIRDTLKKLMDAEIA